MKLKILFACIPADGHFYPLTSLAVHLKNAGHDVRWYTQNVYGEKIKNFEIEYYPFRKAIQLNQYNLDTVFPERLRYSNQVKRLNVDLRNIFVLRAPEFYEDLLEINKDFVFDVLIADVAFTGIPFVRERLNKPVVAIGVFPLMESSKDLPPYGLGLTPSFSFFGRLKQNTLRFVADKILFGKVNNLLQKILENYNIEPTNTNVFDTMILKSTLVLQSGTPGFEYKRSDLGKNIRFIGPLLPYSTTKHRHFDISLYKNRFKKIILVTQGTVEKDVEKLLVPTMEAFKDSDYLVVATTGGSKTGELKTRYPQPNFMIEDFIPFADIMPYADVYVTNGGYGGVMLSIQNQLPMIVAGVHEGKNEIAARVGYFKLGINLKTETPSPKQIEQSAYIIFNDPAYKKNVEVLSREFETYNPQVLCEKYVYEVTGNITEDIAEEIGT